MKATAQAKLENMHSTASRKVPKLVALEAFQIFLLQQYINALFDLGHLRCEAAPNLLDSFREELLVLHLLSGFHDTHNGRL